MFTLLIFFFGLFLFFVQIFLDPRGLGTC